MDKTMKTNMRAQATDALTSAAFKSAWAASQNTNEKTARWAFEKIADIMTAKEAGGSKVLKENLRIVKPELDESELNQLVQKGMRSYMRYWCEAFRLPKYDRAEAANHMRVEGKQNLDQSLEGGKGVILAAGHCGNWDLSGVWLAENYGGCTTVAERLKPESLYQQFVKKRNQFGITIHPHNGEEIAAKLEETLAGGGIVALMCDRDLSRAGVEATMFGKRAKVPAGPAALSLRTGAPVHPVWLSYKDGRPTAEIQPAIPAPKNGSRSEQVAEMTQQLMDTICIGIKKYPEDWHMLQKVFTQDTRKPTQPDKH